MSIIEVRVKYEALESFGQYNNARPAVELVAHLGEGDDVDAWRAELAAKAAETVHALIDDALIAHDQAPRYSKEPRFDVWTLYGNGIPAIVIVPAGALDARVDGLNARHNRSGLVYLQAIDQARRASERGRTMYEGTPLLLDCADGNLDDVERWLAQDDAYGAGEPLVDEDDGSDTSR